MSVSKCMARQWPIRNVPESGSAERLFKIRLKGWNVFYLLMQSGCFSCSSSSFAQKVCILKPGEVWLVCKLQSATEVAKLKCKLCQRKSETSIFKSSKNRNLKGNHNSQIESWIICLNSSAYSRRQENTETYRHIQSDTGAYKSAPNGNDLFLSLD